MSHLRVPVPEVRQGGVDHLGRVPGEGHNSGWRGMPVFRMEERGDERLREGARRLLHLVELIAHRRVHDGGHLLGEGLRAFARGDDRGLGEVDEAQADLLGGFLDGHDADGGLERGHEGREEGGGIGRSRQKIVDQLGGLLPHLLHAVGEAPKEGGEQSGEGLGERRLIGGVGSVQQPLAEAVKRAPTKRSVSVGARIEISLQRRQQLVDRRLVRRHLATRPVSRDPV